jgi:glutamate--cysteine ligase catalytic subunit
MKQVEYLVISHDDKNRKVRLSLRQADILKALASDEELLKKGGDVPDINCGNAK